MKKRKLKSPLSRRKSSNRSRPSKQDQYAVMKAALPTDLTPAQYEAACLRIARELGI